MLVKRGGQYFVGNSFSWAELHFMQFVDLIVSQDSKVFTFLFEFIIYFFTYLSFKDSNFLRFLNHHQLWQITSSALGIFQISGSG